MVLKSVSSRDGGEVRKEQLKEEGLILAHSLRGSSPWQGWQPGRCEVTSHTSCMVRKQR